MKALLIDGTNIAWRAWHAGGTMRDMAGRPTGMATVFLKMVHHALGVTDADVCVVAWDCGVSWRQASCPEYKAQRKKKRLADVDSFGEQMRWLQTTTMLLGVGHVWVENYEADDVLALLSYATCWSEVVLFSSDRDLWQLVSPRVSCVAPARDGLKYVTYATFEDDTGVDGPDTWLAVKLLCGDASDNIRGVAGVGEKTARKLVARVAEATHALKRSATATVPVLTALRNTLEPHMRAVVDRNFALMDLTTGAERLRRNDWPRRTVLPPQRDLVRAKNAIRARQMGSIIATWSSWTKVFECLRPIEHL